MNGQLEKHCWAEVDLGAIRHNFRLVQKAAGSPLLAVVKADAYGHGDAAVAAALCEEGAAGFAVSCLEEALRLRRAGIAKPVLILGHTQPAAAALLAQNGLWQTVPSREYAEDLSRHAAAAGVTVECHLKLDTGMGRLGFAVREEAGLDEAVAEILPALALPRLHFGGAFMHFAVADSTDEADLEFTETQHRLFVLALEKLAQKGVRFDTVHCCNSAASFTRPQWRHSLCRPGIVLYGHRPSAEVQPEGLRPALDFKTVVTQVKTLAAGQSVSYGRTFTAPRAMKAATLAAGYADGYPRLLSGRGMVSIRGKGCPVLGRVCMDQMLVDVSELEEVKRGDAAVLFGAHGAQSVEQVAEYCGTINYEILCRISRRVPRLYKDGGEEFFVNYLE